MSSNHDPHEPREPWIDRWWLVLLILFGLTFTLCLTLYRPQHEWSSVTPCPSVQAAASAISTA